MTGRHNSISLGSNIRRRRLELHLSQSDLARAVGYQSRSAIANIESGESELPASRLLDMARALDTSVESLLFEFSPIGNASSDLHTRVGARNAALVLAGGRSTRNLQNIPNQFVTVLGRPIISWCLDVYQIHPMVDDIIVVCLEGWEPVVSAYAMQSGISKLRSIVKAGNSGVRSVAVGLKRLKDMGYGEDDIVIVQESNRPLVTAEMVSRVLLACQRDGSAVTCSPMADNVQFVRNEDGWSYVDRGLVVDLQSPDAYHVGLLDEVLTEAVSHDAALDENSCAMLFHTLGRAINFCDCDSPNMKIVRQDDLAVFETLVRIHRR